MKEKIFLSLIIMNRYFNTSKLYGGRSITENDGQDIANSKLEILIMHGQFRKLNLNEGNSQYIIKSVFKNILT